MNRGDGSFVEAGAALGLDDLRDARGVAASDFDGDGDVDFVVNNYRAPAAYFENRLGPGRTWLAVRVEGRQANHDGVGAEVTAVVGGRRLLRLVAAGDGYASQYSLEQVFGLGGAPRADSVEVRWPGGRTEAWGPFDAGQRLRLVEGTGRPVGRVSPAAPTARARLPWGAVLGAAAGALVTLGVRRALTRRR
ncbi:MAG: ASPIC/UnbV domain-containing protein [Planctomycetes bacterium]|nr:ASPIC/UnbV domain-containing protein [Planctomycetota bacterium]